MCGRFAQFSPDDVIIDDFDIEDDEAPDLPFNYNIAPTQIVKTVLKEKGNRIVPLKWGLVTVWSQGKNFSLINVRDDSIREKKTFHKNFERNRCIIPADGFYEWKKDAKQKIPYFIHFKSSQLMAFAGLYNVLEGKDNRVEEGKEIRSVAIITTGANTLMKGIHDRMPVILPKNRWEEWLDNGQFDHDKLLAFLEPYGAENEMEMYAVGTEVNSAKNNKPEFIVRKGEIIYG